MAEQNKRTVWITVLVAALGYFVDVYDLVLFSIVRVPSLTDLGFQDKELLDVGVFLLNMQMIGMLVGGVFWGIVGDKKGRVSVLFGSIFLYSVANILNAFVTTEFQYGLMRFLAGVGLAGELGAAITLVSEIMSKESRGYGTAIVAGVGLSGAVFAGLTGDYFSWKTAYIMGGCLGLLLLCLRMGILESGFFQKMKQEERVRKGDFLMLFSSKKRLIKYLSCIFIGVPVWSVIGVLVTFSPEICKELGLIGDVSAGKGIMMAYAGIATGDLISGLISQWIRSRKKVVAFFLTATFICITAILFGGYKTAETFYILCVIVGFFTGYWAVFMTIASEQFGTNLRATVTTTVPNFVRGSVVPLTLSFRYLQQHMSLVSSVTVITLVCAFLAYAALYLLQETYGKDLNYFER